MTAVRHNWFLSKVLTALLVMSLVFAPFHIHGGDISADGLYSATMLTGSGAGHGDLPPVPVKDACAACALLKNFQVSETLSPSVVFETLRVVIHPIIEDVAPHRLITVLFRPPIAGLA